MNTQPNGLAKLYPLLSLLIASYCAPAASEQYHWQGLYVTGYVGDAWANAMMNNTIIPTPLTPTFSVINIDNITTNTLVTESLSPNTPTTSLGVGMNWQTGHLVYGIVADYGLYNLANTDTQILNYPDLPAQFTTQQALNTHWLTTARARFGVVPAESWPLLYLSGGVAFTEATLATSYADNNDAAGTASASSSELVFGWTLGAGFEKPFNQHWSISGEYLYINFGSISTNLPIPCNDNYCSIISAISSTANNFTSQLARIGINYKFS